RESGGSRSRGKGTFATCRRPRGPCPVIAASWISFLRHPHTKEPGWPENQRQNQDAEDDDVGPLAATLEVAGDQRDDDADHETANGCAHDVADAPEHRRGKRDEPGPKPLVEPDRLQVEAIDNAACRGQGRADEKGDGCRSIDVDAHQPGRVTVLRGGTHGSTNPRALDELVQGNHQDNGNQDDEDVGYA